MRDLVEVAIGQVRERRRGGRARPAPEGAAEDRILDALVGAGAQASTRDTFRKKLRAGELDDKEVELTLAGGRPAAAPMFEVPGQPGASIGVMNISDMMSKAFGGRTKTSRTIAVKDAWRPLIAEEGEKLVDQEALTFARPIDAGRERRHRLHRRDRQGGRQPTERRGGGEVSREGVQRDLLPLIEGTTVSTKHGPVKSDHVLFIASGAFHVSKPSDLLPELQGRLPIRVELKALTR